MNSRMTPHWCSLPQPCCSLVHWDPATPCPPPPGKSLAMVLPEEEISLDMVLKWSGVLGLVALEAGGAGLKDWCLLVHTGASHCTSCTPGESHYTHHRRKGGSKIPGSIVYGNSVALGQNRNRVCPHLGLSCPGRALVGHLAAP